jgi:tripartite-type tricarboxylate transporter receptor subunit TctC
MKFSTKIAIAVAAATPFIASAQAPSDYPMKPVKILVGYQAGGPTDMTARLLAAKLQTELGQAFVVENKPGAGSNIASEQLASSPADGYTLMIAAAQMTWNTALYPSVKYDPIKSFIPISKVMTSPAVLVVNPLLPIKSVAELIAYAKKEPGKLSFASSGNGTVPHLNGERFKASTGTNLIHIPYRGAGPALNDVLGGQVNVSFLTALSAVKLIKDGKLRALAAVSSHRLPQLPDVPTLKEVGVSGVDIESWNGLFAPAGTSPVIVKRLSDAVVKIMKEPDVKKVFEDQAATVIGNSAAEFGAELQVEIQRSLAFVKAANIKMD